MRKLSKKTISIFLSVVLVMGIFSLILPTAKLIQNAKAENATKKIDYTYLLQNFKNDVSVNDTRVWNYEREGEGVIYEFGTKGLSEFGIWNAMGLDVAWGALGISHHFFNGTAVGAERNEIHPYIVYNVTPGTSFELSSAVHRDSKENESVLSFYVSNDGVTWIPVDAEKNLEGVWNSTVWVDDDDHRTYGSYDSYVYTIANVGSKTNFVKVEYPMTMASRDDGSEPSSNLLVYGVAFTPVESYAVNSQTLFEAKSFGAQKDLYEEYFIAFPDFINNGDAENAATSNYGMLDDETWGTYNDIKRRSYVAMVAPGSHFYLETTNNSYMKSLGETLVAKNKLESPDKARIRVYSSASLSDDAAWTEWDPMPYSCQETHTPTFNFYLPEDHIYVRIVYPQQGNVHSILGNGANGNDAAFFNDMVFTPYEASEATFTRNYEGGDSVWEGFAILDGSWVSSVAKRGITIPFYGGNNTINNFANDNELNTDPRFENGKFSIAYKAQGGQMFTLNYASRNTDWNPSNSKKCYEANVIDGSKLEFIIESSKDGTIWENAYQTESGYAEKASTFSDDTSIRLFDVSYLVPEGAKYVRVSFGITGVGYVDAANNRLNFNDCLYLRGVSLADANNVYTAPVIPVEYVYTTDTDASKATSTTGVGVETTANAENNTAFAGAWGHLGGNTQMLAGTKERPYVIYDVIPGTPLTFDFSMRKKAIEMSETSANLNLKGGIGRADLAEFEFFVYGRADENSSWTYIGKTDSDSLSLNGDAASYDTFGFGSLGVDIPANCSQVKIELPQTGGFSAGALKTYDYTTATYSDKTLWESWGGPDIGSWNYSRFGLAGESSDQVCYEPAINGVASTYNQAAWDTKVFYLIYQVKPGTTFVADVKLPALSTRQGWKDAGTTFEFVVSSCATIDGTYSNAVTTEGKEADAVIGYQVPTDCNYVKITFPNKGKHPITNEPENHNAYIKAVSFYDSGDIMCGNDVAYLYNVTYATGKKPGPDVDYTALNSANITNASKAELNIYHQANTQLEKTAGIKAKADGAFVIYKIKENTMLTVNSGDALSFEYSTDDTNYKPFEAVKTCRGYEIPAIKDRNYIKVKLDNGEAITNAYAEVLAPTVKFYIPYLDKYDLKDVAGYGAAANSVSPTINTLRPGYKFEGWTEYDDEGIYIDKTVKAVYIPDPDVTYTVSYTVGDNTTTDNTITKNYKFDNRVTISADATNDKGEVFSKWVDAKGATVSNSRNFSFLVSGNIALKAVYAKTKEDIAPYIYVTDEPIISWNNDNEKTWNLSVVWRTAMSGDVTVKETGILLGKDVDKAHLILWDGKTQENTFKMKHNNTATNKTAVYTVKNIKAGETRTALPYAILSNGDVIYGENVIKVTDGVKVTSTDFEFNGTITPTVLNNYLDRAVSYDAFGTADGQDSAIYNARDFVRKTGAKYLARGISSWTLDNNDILSGDNVTNYKNWIAEIHEVDPEVIVEGAIFENVNANVESILIPDWVLKEFGQTVQTDRYFDYDSMLHTLTEKWSSDKYGVNEWGPGNSIPDIGSSEFQMYVYYKACQYIDAGVEAIHFGQMYRIGAEELSFSNEVSKIDLASWETVLTKIIDYAKTHARRGYVLVNGHNHTFAFAKENTKQMLVDFTASPLRLVAANSSDAYSESFQNVGLTSSSGSDAAYITKFTGYTTPSGIPVTDCYPYLLEFDNFGIDTANLNKFYSSGDHVWGYDEISWYVNQQAQYRHNFLTTTVVEWVNNTLPNTMGAANGHVALPGKRTAFISATGASEYLTNEANIYNGIIYSTYYKDGAGKYGTYGAEIPLWDAQIAGDVEAIKAAFDSIN